MDFMYSYIQDMNIAIFKPHEKRGTYFVDNLKTTIWIFISASLILMCIIQFIVLRLSFTNSDRDVGSLIETALFNIGALFQQGMVKICHLQFNSCIRSPTNLSNVSAG